MKNLLITGFDSFGGDSINSSWESVKLLPEQIGEYQLTKLKIPTVFGEASQNVLSVANKIHPDMILCVGQAGGRSDITIEVIAINLREARIPDNVGNQPTNSPVLNNGPAAYFTTVPVRKMVEAITEKGIPSALSYSAGAFVCNDTLYTLLHFYDETSTQVGFIHVPYLPEQVKENTVPSLTLNQIVEALSAAICKC